jgi:hypothetical protein
VPIIKVTKSFGGSMGTKEIKRDKFKKIAERRTNDILEKLRILGNCSNRINYYYTEEDVDIIFNALEDGLIKTRQLFKQKDKEGFSFKFE